MKMPRLDAQEKVIAFSLCWENKKLLFEVESITLCIPTDTPRTVSGFMRIYNLHRV